MLLTVLSYTKGQAGLFFWIFSDLFELPRCEWHLNVIWSLVHNHRGASGGDEQEELLCCRLRLCTRGKWLFGIQRNVNKMLLYQNRAPRGFTSGERKPGFSWDCPLQPTSLPLCPALVIPPLRVTAYLSPSFGWKNSSVLRTPGFCCAALVVVFQGRAWVIAAILRREKDGWWETES